MRSHVRPKALIAAWFDFQSPATRIVAEQLQHAVRAAAPDLTETVKWGNLVFQLDGAAVLAIAPHKAHVNLQLFNGGQLPDAAGALDGTGRGSRSLRCKLNQALDPVQVEMLVSASVALSRQQAAERPPRMRPTDDDPQVG
jgi:hypothetical protein